MEGEWETVGWVEWSVCGGGVECGGVVPSPMVLTFGSRLALNSRSMTGWVSQKRGSAVEADSIISPSCTLDVDSLGRAGMRVDDGEGGRGRERE